MAMVCLIGAILVPIFVSETLLETTTSREQQRFDEITQNSTTIHHNETIRAGGKNNDFDDVGCGFGGEGVLEGME